MKDFAGGNLSAWHTELREGGYYREGRNRDE